ncbi:nucleoside/nucleotide kinase family protein [Paracoccus contaminans]|uniref:nucleoside/nucleotide kinase family protein n=1 Tax=Paracoccus contaminans TaxID=1945662 RepID=UPI001F0A0A37|nr:nucleoside/nucleotide kinase family protein [Paracoccus contaminans]
MNGPWAEAIAGPLAAAIDALAPGRRLVALAGPPGAGKSTLAEQAAAMLPGATVLPMDGYHLDNRILSARGLLDRKGSPGSFDAAGFLSLLGRLRQGGEVIHPLFDRERDIAIAGAGRIGPEHPLVLVEGNYLLLDRPVWRDMRPLFDLTVMVTADRAVLAERLRRRWQGLGRDEAAIARHLANDLANLDLVLHGSAAADLTLESGGSAD